MDGKPNKVQVADGLDVPVLPMHLEKDQVELAVKALRAHAEVSRDKKKELFEEKDVFWILMSLKKIPAPKTRPYKIPLCHSVNKDAEVCFISTLPGKEVKQILAEKGVTSINKVISVTKLQKNYKTFALRRQLCAAFDLFLCDAKIFKMMPGVLGNAFYSRKKQPLPVEFSRNAKAEINKALECTTLSLGHGPCSSIKVATSDMTHEQVIENIMAVADFLSENVPRGWKNIKSLHLKTSKSIALPIYNSIPEFEGDADEKEDTESSKKRSNDHKTKKRRKRPLFDSMPDHDPPRTLEGSKDTTKSSVGTKAKTTAAKKKRRNPVPKSVQNKA